jgi:hypothetical protein
MRSLETLQFRSQNLMPTSNMTLFRLKRAFLEADRFFFGTWVDCVTFYPFTCRKFDLLF